MNLIILTKKQNEIIEKLYVNIFPICFTCMVMFCWKLVEYMAVMCLGDESISVLSQSSIINIAVFGGVFTWVVGLSTFPIIHNFVLSIAIRLSLKYF